MRRLGRVAIVVALMLGTIGLAPGVAAAAPGATTVTPNDVVSWGNTAQFDWQWQSPAAVNGASMVQNCGSGVLVLTNTGKITQVGSDTPLPSAIAALTGVVKIAAASALCAALKGDGTVVDWTPPGSKTTPTVPASLAGVVDIAVGAGYVVALKADGTVTAWGDASANHLAVPTGLSGVVSIATSSSGYTLAVKSNGSVVAWGTSAPAVPGGLSNVVSVAPEDGFALALKSDGTVAAWGSDTVATAVPAGLSGVVSVVAAADEGPSAPGVAFAVKSDGTVVGWGGDDYNGVAQSVPAGLSGVISVVTDGVIACAIKSDGTSVSWGDSHSAWMYDVPGIGGIVQGVLDGQYGYALAADGTVYWGGGWSENMAQPGNLSGVSFIDAGSAHELAWMGNGTLNSWGDDKWGQTDVQMQDLTGVTQISAGGSENMARKSDGTVFHLTDDTWYGDDPYAPPAGLTGVSKVEVGGSLWNTYILALKSNGTVTAWGDSYNGQTTVPVGLTGVTAVSAGDYCALALKSNQTVVSWGTYCPALPAGLTGVTAISAGGDFNLALKSNGTVAAWGDNSHSQSTVPAGLTGVKAIAAGYDFAVALKTDGTLVAWGNNDHGQASVPAGLTGVTSITAGDDFASAIYTLSPAATTITVSGLGTPRTAGVSGAITVQVKDSLGRPAFGYRGTIHFTSSDPSALLPSNYTFTGGDPGAHTFVVALPTVGSRSVTVTDTLTASLHGSQSAIVVNAPTVPGAPTGVRAAAANGSAVVSWLPPV